MADRYRREPRDRDYRDGGYSSRSHVTGHSTFAYSSNSRRSPSPSVSTREHSRRSSPPPRASAAAAPSIHTMIAQSCTSITLDERFTTLKRARSPSPSPPRESLPAGSARNRQYLDQLAHRTDVLDKIEGDNHHSRPRDRARSPLSQPSRSARPSNGSQHRGDETYSTSRSDRLEATKRIAASRVRGNVHSRLGINRTVGGTPGAGLAGRVGQRPMRDGVASGASRATPHYSQFVKHPRPQHQQRQQQQQQLPAHNRAGVASANDLDDELDAYMKQRA